MPYLRSLCLTCLTLFCLLLASPACLLAVEGRDVEAGRPDGLSAVSFETASPVLSAGGDVEIVVESPLSPGQDVAQDIFVEVAPCPRDAGTGDASCRISARAV